MDLKFWPRARLSASFTRHIISFLMTLESSSAAHADNQPKRLSVALLSRCRYRQSLAVCVYTPLLVTVPHVPNDAWPSREPLVTYILKFYSMRRAIFTLCRFPPTRFFRESKTENQVSILRVYLPCLFDSSLDSIHRPLVE
ncbi:hypothetical protein GYMLUDRAFT_956359 [Collybiopsis luxurians FD-317 M1]|nr:hypothetical protein GYMLUDRAFT_956359 [Collybiopsis luxurians FD-317 M1]